MARTLDEVTYKQQKRRDDLELARRAKTPFASATGGYSRPGSTGRAGYWFAISVRLIAV
jgi:hypothetical protein